MGNGNRGMEENQKDHVVSLDCGPGYSFRVANGIVRWTVSHTSTGTCKRLHHGKQSASGSVPPVATRSNPRTRNKQFNHATTTRPPQPPEQHRAATPAFPFASTHQTPTSADGHRVRRCGRGARGSCAAGSSTPKETTTYRGAEIGCPRARRLVAYRDNASRRGKA